jgi:hypothetical protein
MKWEYKTVWVDETGHYSDERHYNPGALSFTEQHRFDWKPLNDLGAAGWELVSIAPLSLGTGIGVAFFKRSQEKREVEYV